MELQIDGSGALYPASLPPQASFSGWENQECVQGSPAGCPRLGEGLFETNSERGFLPHLWMRVCLHGDEGAAIGWRRGLGI